MCHFETVNRGESFIWTQMVLSIVYTLLRRKCSHCTPSLAVKPCACTQFLQLNQYSLYHCKQLFLVIFSVSIYCNTLYHELSTDRSWSNYVSHSHSALLQATIWTTGSVCRCWKGTELKPRRRSYRPLHPLQAPSPLLSHLITPGTLNSAPSATPTRCRGIRQLLRALLHIEVSLENNHFVLLNCKIH